MREIELSEIKKSVSEMIDICVDDDQLIVLLIISLARSEKLSDALSMLVSEIKEVCGH